MTENKPKKKRALKPKLIKENKVVKMSPERDWLYGVLDYHHSQKVKRLIVLTENKDGEIFFSHRNTTKKDRVFMLQVAMNAEVGGYSSE